MRPILLTRENGTGVRAVRGARAKDTGVCLMQYLHAPGGGGALSYKRLMGMCRWMGSHFHD